MNLLLDTNAFLRWVNGDESLSMAARTAIDDPANRVFFSAITAWEIAIKTSIGKLRIGAPVDRYIAEYVHAKGLDWLSIDLSDIARVEALPLHHRDPFDRLLIAQAQARQLTIVSADSAFPHYDIPLIA